MPRSSQHPTRAHQSRAFVTFMIADDSYLPGALVLAYALRRQHVKADLVCLVTEEISKSACSALNILYDRVLRVERITQRCKRAKGHPAIPHMFTRLNALRLGKDGDLGCAYDKVVVLDADVLPLKHYQELFTLEAPAGILNEAKDHLIEVDGNNRYLLPADVDTTGKWRWHDLYDPVCPHGAKIPQAITDRVRDDPENMGISGALFVFRPSFREFQKILKDLERPAVRHLVRNVFTWPDMQYLTMRWSGLWTNIDARFCGLNGYPKPSVLFGNHFAGVKPWALGNRSIGHYSRFEDFGLWYRQYQQMLRQYPALRRVHRLQRLLEGIEKLQGPQEQSRVDTGSYIKRQPEYPSKRFEWTAKPR